MCKQKSYLAGLLVACVLAVSCKVPALVTVNNTLTVPATFGISTDSTTIASIEWRTFFSDPNLAALVDSALQRNQELLITLQEIEMTRNDVQFRQGPLQPTVSARLGTGVEKVGRYTSQGAGDASTEIKPGMEVPENLTDITGGLYANWEVDIWKKLHKAKAAAITRYLASREGRNFVVTNLVAEIASSYYELLALDNQLQIVQQNIGLQKNALEIVKVQKEASRVTELAVQKFEAEVLKTQSLEYEILQKINETENRINLLTGRFPQPVLRSQNNFLKMNYPAVQAGIPSQMLAARPDIKQAELELEAARLDVKVARAEFYPSLGISAVLGLQAFKPSFLYKLPESLLYSVAGDLAAPLVNRNAIKAEFSNANARQLQALYNYQRTILNAYLEVATQLSNISNLQKTYDLRSRQVNALNKSVDIAGDLFKSARADYFEVLMTQRDALESKLELVETKKEQMNAVVQIYRNLGGGWR